MGGGGGGEPPPPLAPPPPTPPPRSSSSLLAELDRPPSALCSRLASARAEGRVGRRRCVCVRVCVLCVCVVPPCRRAAVPRARARTRADRVARRHEVGVDLVVVVLGNMYDERAVRCTCVAKKWKCQDEKSACPRKVSWFKRADIMRMSVAGARTFAVWVRGFALGVRVRGGWELPRQGSAPVAPPPAHRSGVRPDGRIRRRWSEARSSGRWPEVRVTPQRVRKPLHLWRKSRRVYVTRGLLSIILELHFEARVCTRGLRNRVRRRRNARIL